MARTKLVLSIALFVVFLSACGSGNAPSPNGLAQELTETQGLEQAADVLQQALAAGGIATVDAGEPHMTAVAPLASAVVSVPETFHLAMEARYRETTGRMTLAELGRVLRDLGWPFRPETTPGDQLVDLLALWTTEAQKQPGDPLSFTPLFLAEMAKRQAPAVDIAAGAYQPEALRLTLLELQLFAAAFDRLVTPGSKDGQTDLGWLVQTAHAADGPCSALKESLGKLGGDAAGLIVGEGVNAGLEAGLEAAGVDDVEGFKNAMSSLGIAAKVWRLIAIYNDAQVAVTVESDNPLHKFLESEGQLYSAFTATAGVSDEDWEAYQEAIEDSQGWQTIRDCMSFAGLPTLTNLGDLGKEAGDWRVEWDLVEGSPAHAYISLAPNNFSLISNLEMDLTRTGAHSASASLVVDVLPEEGNAHQGEEQTGRVTAKAELDTSQAPGLGTFVNALKGGLGDVLALSDALVDIAAGMFQEFYGPRAYATLIVSYHGEAPQRWTGTITHTRKAESSGSERSERDPRGGHPRDGSRSFTAKDMTQHVWEIAGEGVANEIGVVIIPVKVSAEIENLRESQSYHRMTNSCAGNIEPTWESEHTIDGDVGSATSETTAQIRINEDGSYRVVIGRADDQILGTTTYVSEWRHGPSCGASIEPRSTNESWEFERGIRIVGVDGQLDPDDPCTISGSETETDHISDRASVTIMVTWDLTCSTP